MENQNNDTHYSAIMDCISHLELEWGSITSTNALKNKIDAPLAILGCDEMIFISSSKTLTSPKPTFYKLQIGKSHLVEEISFTENNSLKFIRNIEKQNTHPLLKMPVSIPSPLQGLEDGKIQFNYADEKKLVYATYHSGGGNFTGYTLFTTQKDKVDYNIELGNTLFLLLDSIHEKLASIGTKDSLRQIKISPREKDVLQLLVKGKTNTEIAADLAISPYTISSHINVLSLKLGSRNRTMTALKAVKFGLAKI